MEVKQEKVFDANFEKQDVWKVLNDPWKVATCLPGAQLVEDLGDNKYKGKVKVKIGPVTTNFDGEVEFTKLDAETYEMSVKGQGADNKGKGNASMTLDLNLGDSEGGKTQVFCRISLSISGRIAQFGARMITAVNNKMFDQFTKNFLDLLERVQSGDESIDPNADNSVKMGSVLGSVVKDSIVGVFKKKP